MFKAIKLLDEVFAARNLHYTVTETERYQEIDVPFEIQNGPSVILRFLSFDGENDITILIPNLVNNVPAEKRFLLLDTLNEMNRHFRYMKFFLDPKNNLDVQYDFLQHTGDESLGEMGYEIFVRTLQIMNESYPKIAKALYAPEEKLQDENKEEEEKKDLLRILEENHDGINIRITKMEESEGETN